MNKKKKSALHKVNKWPYLFSAPFLIAYFLFSLYPMLYSLELSFFDWNGIGTKTFIGFKNYINLFTKDPLFFKSLKNTIILMAFSTPITVFLGLTVAYLLFDIGRGKRLYQTVNFFPYITTPVAIGFIFSYLFDWQSGYVNKILVWLGILDEPFFWLGSETASKVLIVVMVVWRWLGYYMTIYLAAMTSMPMEVYEAAAVDGAGRFRRIWHITLPGIKMTVALLAILSLGNVLNAGFDQIFNLYNPLVYSTGDILDTWVYRAGLVNLQFSLATAVGLLKSVVSFVLITLGYWMAYKFAEYKLF